MDLKGTLTATRPFLYEATRWNGVPWSRSSEFAEVSLKNAPFPANPTVHPCLAISVGRHCFLFIGDVGAGQRSATLYSLLGSCLRRGINPRDYLHWLFARLPAATTQMVHTLRPAAYAAMTAGNAPGGQQAAA